ncbi:large subunit ribosomal protein L25 [Paucidesulfovibrio gracilis DSM 16080]|uniref:Large ribosomal subunit protein bL25 n=1 Tax=Paucidesulfovibrio gracilis DSM 16080 TaxID=1121449 RepID=A0A1T4W445_9BACT|nr:50S ribosomal protein L25 [Paucidesulfovibrio gracilis]SKA72012.1 large subunit ribosomal protein L25 [Paucidesulfovibrio gracilis DSM 16080]
MAKKAVSTLTVAERTATGKGPNRRLRAQGIVPGVYYDQHGTNIMVQVAEVPLRKVYEKVGGTQVFHLEIDRNGNKETFPSLVWRLKHDPVRPVLTHVDFFGVDLDKDLKVFVNVVTTGTPKGLKQGGKLDIFRDQLEIICKPLDIPEHIEIEVSELDVNDNVHIEDITLPDGVTALYEENFAVVGVTPITETSLDDEEEEDIEEAGEEEAAE